MRLFRDRIGGTAAKSFKEAAGKAQLFRSARIKKDSALLTD
jgi:hypothetical protein